MIISSFKNFKGFTLIELLIVVAIIAILAAIAIPNFLEAQIRSKVSRVKSDLKSVATAIESYAVDHNYYPNGPYPPSDTEPNGSFWYIFDSNKLSGLCEITTPVAYFSNLEQLKDPFQPLARFEPQVGGYNGGVLLNSYLYFNLGSGYGTRALRTWAVRASRNAGDLNSSVFLKAWILTSNGPNRMQAELERGALGNPPNDPNPNIATTEINGVSNFPRTLNKIYDPTNGTISDGDIGRTGGDTRDGRAAVINGN